MLGGKKTPAARIDTLVGRNTQITGDLHFSGGLHVDGAIHGSVSSESGAEAVLSLSQHGIIKGEVRVPHVVINGTVEGDVYAEQKLELGSEARVTGDVHYNLIEMTVGATVNGKMAHTPSGPMLLSHHKPAQEPMPAGGRAETRD